MRIVVTGGCGFIGSSFVHLCKERGYDILVVDKCTYAGNISNLPGTLDVFDILIKDICDVTPSDLGEYDYLVNFAAESHVDNSIADGRPFVRTNVEGTFNLLECARQNPKLKRFIQISTDEVYGDLSADAGLFTEQSSYEPSSPYAASKASSDHLVRAWHRTYGLPVLLTNCSNNYGPYHFPEKLIPLMILNALEGKPLPVYGNGQQIRDWLYVEDHARALLIVATKGKIGETYNIGGCNEKANIDVVKGICALLEEFCPQKPEGVAHYADLITFVKDRPGHDLRYAIDASKIEREMGWKPQESFESGLRKTVAWFLENKTWWQRVLDGSYNRERLGVGSNLAGED